MISDIFGIWIDIVLGGSEVLIVKVLKVRFLRSFGWENDDVGAKVELTIYW